MEYRIYDGERPLKHFSEWSGKTEEQMREILLGIAAGLRAAGRKRVSIELYRVEATADGERLVLIRAQN